MTKKGKLAYTIKYTILANVYAISTNANKWFEKKK